MLNLYEILQEVINESVSMDEVSDAIDNKYQVIINYSDENNNAPRKRIIEPYALGYSKAGNPVFRAYQYNGDTLRGVPKWKLFRLDRVKSWNPTKRHFNMPPDENGWNAERYNEIGDGSMNVVINQVNFSNDSDSEYSPNNRLNINRKRTSNLKNSEPINISQMKDELFNDNNTNDSTFNEPKIQIDRATLERNIRDTMRKKAKSGHLLSPYNDEDKEPIINNTINNVMNDDNSENNDNVDSNTKDILNTNDENFKKMLNRNLKITQDEKNKRGFSLSNKKI